MAEGGFDPENDFPDAYVLYDAATLSQASETQQLEKIRDVFFVHVASRKCPIQHASSGAIKMLLKKGYAITQEDDQGPYVVQWNTPTPLTKIKEEMANKKQKTKEN
jgi:hypothetical protein